MKMCHFGTKRALHERQQNTNTKTNKRIFQNSPKRIHIMSKYGFKHLVYSYTIHNLSKPVICYKSGHFKTQSNSQEIHTDLHLTLKVIFLMHVCLLYMNLYFDYVAILVAVLCEIIRLPVNRPFLLNGSNFDEI